MFTFFSTPSHGYLKVPRAKYTNSGYKASRFSYEDATHVFLEEDCDASGFMKAANVSIDNIKETAIEYDPTAKLSPMSGEGFELRIGEGY